MGDLELPKPKSTGHKSSSMQDSSKLEVSPKLHVYRRPYGVGVASLTNSVSDLLDSTAPTKDITVLTPTKESFTEERFESLHLAAIDEYLGNTQSSSRNENPRLPSWAQKGGSIAVRLFAFINDQINVNSTLKPLIPQSLLDEAPFIAGAPFTNCAFLNETNDPRINRDDLYITLREGSFTRDGKRSKEYFVKVSMVLDTGSKPIN